jgi:NhaP-type Na+/H+ or K+/H+ antiporter
MSQLTSSEINIALVTLGGLVIVLGLFSGFLKERFFLSDPIVALLVGSLVICASILAHGLTAVPLAKLYAKHAQSRRNREKVADG